MPNKQLALNATLSPAPTSTPNRGQVFTPPFLATWTAQVLADRLPLETPLSILDPACGDGALLTAAKRVIPHADLYGADIDPDVAQLASLRLEGAARVHTIDMLASLELATKRFGSLDALICNPPWGADVAVPPADLRAAGFSLATGQYDSWCLFVEASFRLLKDDGIAVFILPDAVFMPEHAPVRRLLATRSTLELIARLGEGLFKGIYRGTTVIAFRNTPPPPHHLVNVFRLLQHQRRAVLRGLADLAHVFSDSSSKAPQRRFHSDGTCRWDIDVRASDSRTIRKLEANPGDWYRPLDAGRGVEISKKGLTVRCPACSYSIPKPTRTRQVVCPQCNLASNSDDMPTRKVVKPLDANECLKGHIPFVVGEDVNRYRMSCTRQIQLGVPGLNYKSLSTYAKERLLIRKTGVGLKATITDDYAATNQVVFHYSMRPDYHNYGFYLHYLLGVLCSRIVFAYHLQKAGENEWRSHPYVTPKSLRALPIPCPRKGTRLWAQAHSIASEVRKHLINGGQSQNRDLRIERLVAGLYELDSDDIRWVKRVICSAQNLEPMRALGSFDESSLHAVYVS